jgi:hypothetical protein
MSRLADAVERLETLADLNDSVEDGDPRNTTVSVRDLRTVLAALKKADARGESLLKAAESAQYDIGCGGHVRYQQAYDTLGKALQDDADMHNAALSEFRDVHQTGRKE